MSTIRQVKKLVVAVMGFTMLIAGIAMIVLPGPAFIFIPAGLAILATEFLWAKKLLQKVKEKLRRDKESKEKQSENEDH
jgi:tellurite resistance protein TerC